MNKVFKLVDLLQALEFDYKINDDNTLSLVDLLGANLGNIEGDRFTVDEYLAMYLIDRLTIYIEDYFINEYVDILVDKCNEDITDYTWESLLGLMKKHKDIFKDTIDFVECLCNPELFTLQGVI